MEKKRKERQSEREGFVGREEIRGSDNENMRREKMRELTLREREKAPKKIMFLAAIEVIK